MRRSWQRAECQLEERPLIFPRRLSSDLTSVPVCTQSGRDQADVLRAPSPKIADHILTTFTLSLVVTSCIGSISGIPETLAKRHFSSSDDTTRHPSELTFNPKVEGSIPSGPTYQNLLPIGLLDDDGHCRRSNRAVTSAKHRQPPELYANSCLILTNNKPSLSSKSAMYFVPLSPSNSTLQLVWLRSSVAGRSRRPGLVPETVDLDTVAASAGCRVECCPVPVLG